jgi:hypothetical protein
MIVSKSRQGDFEGLDLADFLTVLAEQESVMLLGTLVHEGELVPPSELFIVLREGLINSMSL